MKITSPVKSKEFVERIIKAGQENCSVALLIQYGKINMENTSNSIEEGVTGNKVTVSLIKKLEK